MPTGTATDRTAPTLRDSRRRPGSPTTPTRRAGTSCARCSTGCPATAAELADRFAGPLTFGTAGLRGPLRAGPNGMNLAVVTQAAAGLVGWLAAQGARGPAGHRVRRPARLAGVRRADRPGRHRRRPARRCCCPGRCPRRCSRTRCAQLGAVAGVMVTASHNPPQDNGYKVYLGAALGGPLGAGAQIVPPADAGIEAAIRAVGPLPTVPLGAPGDGARRRHRQRPTWTAPPRCSTRTARATWRWRTRRCTGSAARCSPRPSPRAGFDRPGGGARAGRAGPGRSRPSRSPTRRSRARWTCSLALADRDRRRPRHRQRPRRRPVRGGDPGPGRRLADAARRRGGRAARRPPDAPRRAPGRYATTIVSSSLLRAMCARAGRAVRRDADRLQVDRAGRRRTWPSATRRRSATASRPATCATRTASPPR